MKKQVYILPQTQAIDVQVSSALCASGAQLVQFKNGTADSQWEPL